MTYPIYGGTPPSKHTLKITYPEIYNFKTPQKDKLTLTDAKWIMKDDHLHVGQWNDPEFNFDEGKNEGNFWLNKIKCGEVKRCDDIPLGSNLSRLMALINVRMKGNKILKPSTGTVIKKRRFLRMTTAYGVHMEMNDEE